jgi:hypothetical protein
MFKKKTTNFDIFKREFKKWQRKLGLMGYKIYFLEAALDGSWADISVNQEMMVVTLRWTSNVDTEIADGCNPAASAKHEAMHLLINRLENLGRQRTYTESEMYEASEELARKLEDLIPDEEKK